MTPERAIELVKWGRHYANPRPKNDAEYRKALAFIEASPELAEEIQWTST